MRAISAYMCRAHSVPLGTLSLLVFHSSLVRLIVDTARAWDTATTAFSGGYSEPNERRWVLPLAFRSPLIRFRTLIEMYIELNNARQLEWLAIRRWGAWPGRSNACRRIGNDSIMSLIRTNLGKAQNNRTSLGWAVRTQEKHQPFAHWLAEVHAFVCSSESCTYT